MILYQNNEMIILMIIDVNTTCTVPYFAEYNIHCFSIISLCHCKKEAQHN